MAKFDPKKEVTQKLKFKPDSAYGNLCIGYLNNVEFKTTDVDLVDDKGNPTKWEYAGLKIPSLVFEFKQIKKNENDPDRFYYHVEGVITQFKKDGSEVEKSKVESMYSSLFDRILHIHNAYAGSPNYKEIDTTEMPEINENADVATRAKQITAFYKIIANSFNVGKNKKKIYVDDKDKPIVMCMKLLAEYTTGTRLTFPTFVGEGFIEKFIGLGKQTIEIKANESIELVSKKKPSAAAINKVQDDLPEEVLKLIKGVEG